MSIATELLRIVGAKAALKASINAKGGTITDETLDEYAAQVDDITIIDFLAALTTPASAGHILASKEAYSDQGIKITGTMVDRGTVSTDISAVATEVTIAAGKHSGSGVVKIAAAEQAKIIPANIAGVATILGVPGKFEVVDTTSGDAAATEIKIGKKAWVDGAELTGTRYFWLEDYAKAMQGMFILANLPNSVVFTAPQVTAIANTFQQTLGMTELVLTVSNSVTIATYIFNANTVVRTVTFNFTTANVTSFLGCFKDATALDTISGALNLTATTNATDMFLNTSSLVSVLFVANTIKINLSLVNSPLLSSASLVSIGNGLLEGASAKTLTMHATSKTAMSALMGDITGAAGSQVFTANPAGADTLTHFITDHKVWTIA
jgi:hypothetical protein